MTLFIPVCRLDHAKDLPLPRSATPDSAGIDLSAAITEDILLHPGKRVLVPIGITLAIPKGYEAQIRPRSGLALKNGLTVLNSPGTIDADYRGEIKVILINLGEQPFVVQRGMRIAQMIISPVVKVTLEDKDQLLDSNDRGEGFGSTGLHVV